MGHPIYFMLQLFVASIVSKNIEELIVVASSDNCGSARDIENLDIDNREVSFTSSDNYTFSSSESEVEELKSLHEMGKM